MFFQDERQQFFRPLTSKYREQIRECLTQLYQVQFSASKVDYAQLLTREQILDVFQEALVRAPILLGFEENEQRFKNEREQAGYILNQLIECGWIEKQVDDATLQSSFAFSRYGRLFTEPFIHTARASRTRQRNTRNTLNALNAFLVSDDVYDLIDAWEFSERIVSDFTDVIAELEERRRDLIREAGNSQMVEQAAEQFFDFMEKRFESDLSIRLSADSVEKYRDRICDITQKLKRKKNDFKVVAERRLRQLFPEMLQDNNSIYIDLLDTIEQRIKNASDAMLPQVRSALQSFTKRADIIIRQMSFIASQQHNDVIDICQKLSALSPEEQAERLDRTGTKLTQMNVGFIDPANVFLHAKRKHNNIDMFMDEGGDFDPMAHKEMYIQQMLDQAFFINDSAIRTFLTEQLMTHNQVSTKDIPIQSAQDLLVLTHAIEAASQSSDGAARLFNIEPTGNIVSNEYLQSYDEFVISFHESEIP
ncbi:Wadjet anti-phage system protein JetA family protein [Marinicellulosiphila megalodicopiae]|uniref:Wadjet anti-phage system protein JetA family protein n=1 Tax=Marinicellulosiphila megalodicopiae TaxID=2724896 RepID=UPI003BAE5E9E